MKNVKRILAVTTAIGMLSTGAVFAQEEDIMLIDTPPAEEAAADVAVVNGAKITGVEIKDVNGVAMMPLRLVGEALGYTVNWNGENQSIEMIKGAQFITMAIDTDSYAFSRRAPQTLGTAPTLVNGDTTYVPLSFVTEIMGGYYEAEEGGTYKIVNPSIVGVTAVQEDGSLLVADSFHGEVVVYIGEDTKIFANGEEAKAEDIKAEATLAIEYSDVMTMSIPPQTTAVRIDIQNPVTEAEEVEAEEAESVAYAGKIAELDAEFVTIDTEDGQVTLIVTEDTTVQHVKNKRLYTAEDLEVGMEISGTHSVMSTRSIPPQTQAYTIVING